MLTTTVDGLWVLQVLAGVEVVGPELGLRPHLPSVETPDMALAHPIARELIAAGVIDGGGAVDSIVREWLTVLARRDVALLVHMPSLGASGDVSSAIVARFAQWWTVLERCDAVVRLSAAGTAGTEFDAKHLIGNEIGRLLGATEPASIRPATVDADAMVTAVSDRNSLHRFLIEQRLDNDQVRVLLDAAADGRCAQASIVAIQSGVSTAPARSHIEPGVVTVIDTAGGRLIAEHFQRDGRAWMVVGPGTPASIGAAVQKMLCRLPAQSDWYSYRKAV